MELLVMKSVGQTPSCWITPYDTLMEGLVFLITVWTQPHVHKWFLRNIAHIKAPTHLIYTRCDYPLYSGLFSALVLFFPAILQNF